MTVQTRACRRCCCLGAVWAVAHAGRRMDVWFTSSTLCEHGLVGSLVMVRRAPGAGSGGALGSGR